MTGYMDAASLTHSNPYEEINEYLRLYPKRDAAMRKTLDYFDCINFAPRITASMLVTVGAAAGMSTYVYYAIRPAMQPLYVEVEIDSVRAFFDYITGGDFKRRMFAYDMQTMAGERMMWLVGLLRANLGLPILFASVGGLVVLFVRSVHLGVVVAAPVLLGSAYAMGYAVGDARIFALPAVYMLLVAAAVGLGWISARAASLGKLP